MLFRSLREVGCSYIELGHAERRSIFQEDDRMINEKILSVLKNGMNPIFCIGEKEKNANMKDNFNFLSGQLKAGLDKVSIEDLEKVIIAYEPIWAIGASESAPIEYTEEIMGFLREYLDREYGSTASKKQIIIYGGSVKPSSAPDILKLENNNGIFIGRAALNLEYFTEMVMMGLKASQ